MRLGFILLVTTSTLFAHGDAVTATAINNAALTGAMSLGFLQLIGADERVSDQFRFLRGSKIAENENEERGGLDAKSFVEKLFRTNSFSELKKIDELTELKAISAAVDDKLAAVFKFADDAKMRPGDLAKIVNKFDGFDDALKTKALEEYTKYWNTMH
ncbi:hypothetical protein F441_13121 [Phytophthora nicotianae CJ01A1]|uniref:RxLR effector protein n=5 Tax=Phytophthora nicotianae TaxID=4792 RepID=W2R4F0_PHYN3|nr:hypothetical protein PPTG_03209 [Phytophthora nicotianae INRA-310]ETI41613.1 hypothetical protein F443_13168 [Phytophthora nicotianae P1569]ETL35065.1 hypothetical protein L916_12767 [Phytophthora nicotianae]ETO70263.1 hypothetical protein F444_13240 [Phytophthora nicotianae P1976]ETP11365.1 hypothetical protein F441_13121 [Phytophthora nicotianae CJ01A1]KUF78072.1 hypothetical protein AM587_10010290 [Phytophthora nicotianae]